MAESSLSVSYHELVRAVGRFLGYGADPSVWDQDQKDEVDDHLKAGLRRFYGAHKWSFLRPVHTLATVAAQAQYPLPDNFAAIVGDITFAAGSQRRWGVRLIPDVQMRKLRALPQSGRPQVASVVPLTADGTTGQRKQLTLYPAPDAVFDVTFAMQLIPEAITADNPYPLGGQQFSEAIREACLAVAESDMDDAQRVHAERFAEELTRAIGVDATHRSIDTLGYNSDPGSMHTSAPRRRSTVSVNGVPIADL